MLAALRKPIVIIPGAILAMMIICFVSMQMVQKLTAPDVPERDYEASTVRLSRVYVASRRIPARTELSPGLMETKRIPRDAIPPDAVRLEREVSGYVTKRDIPEGMLIRKSNLRGHIDTLGMAATLPKGRRAMVLAIKPEPTLHHLLLPGDRIDVTVSLDDRYAQTVVSNIEVLAVDHDPSEDPETSLEETDADNQSVTLLVTKDEAERLALCTTYGAAMQYVMHSELSE